MIQKQIPSHFSYVTADGSHRASSKAPGGEELRAPADTGLRWGRGEAEANPYRKWGGGVGTWFMTSGLASRGSHRFTMAADVPGRRGWSVVAAEAV